ncbi:hypothetical protein DY000_02031796 [Brassica cretica]|uniref:Uncharacterized protein n=1 Tax=Brassica cretica TaxID=69181 RepID=A0ABQ7DSQ9_BRACR|nr:hypothetical protein DY000_02031796 [Brassica cretica]
MILRSLGMKLQQLLRKEWDRGVVVMDKRIRSQWLIMGVYKDKNARGVHTTYAWSLRVNTYALTFSGPWVIIGTEEWSYSVYRLSYYGPNDLWHIGKASGFLISLDWFGNIFFRNRKENPV